MKERSSSSEGESGGDSQDAFLSQEDRLGKAGAAMVTIPKAEKDVDDFDVRPATQCHTGSTGCIVLQHSLQFAC